MVRETAAIAAMVASFIIQDFRLFVVGFHITTIQRNNPINDLLSARLRAKIVKTEMPRIIVQGVDPRFAERIDRRLADDKLDPIERGPIEGDRQFGAGQVSRLIPLGIAETDQELLWIDPLDYASDLAGGVQTLRAAGVNVSVYNLPLACSIDRYGGCRSLHLGLEKRLPAHLLGIRGPGSMLRLLLNGPTENKPGNPTY